MDLETIIALVLVENNVQHCVVLARKIVEALHAATVKTAPAPVANEPMGVPVAVATAPVAVVPVEPAPQPALAPVAVDPTPAAPVVLPVAVDPTPVAAAVPTSTPVDQNSAVQGVDKTANL